MHCVPFCVHNFRYFASLTIVVESLTGVHLQRRFPVKMYFTNIFISTEE